MPKEVTRPIVHKASLIRAVNCPAGFICPIRFNRHERPRPEGRGATLTCVKGTSPCGGWSEQKQTNGVFQTLHKPKKSTAVVHRF